jgi:hypothetical protein
MKSAYELALERLENQGIRRPDDTALDEATRSKVEELRNQKEAKLAELEILHQDRLRKMQDPHSHQLEQEEYVRERRRIAESCEEKIDKLREQKT